MAEKGSGRLTTVSALAARAAGGRSPHTAMLSCREAGGIRLPAAARVARAAANPQRSKP
jgi:hypothetical protein